MYRPRVLFAGIAQAPVAPVQAMDMQLQQKFHLVLTICHPVCFEYPLVPCQFLSIMSVLGQSRTGLHSLPRPLLETRAGPPGSSRWRLPDEILRCDSVRRINHRRRWCPTAKTDAKPSVVVRLNIQRICLVCVRKGSCRDDSVAFTDVFWPCGTALHATFHVRRRGIKN